MHAKFVPARDRTEWLSLRRQGLGSSDAPAVLGFCPYRTAIEVYHDKNRLGPPVADGPLPAGDPRNIGTLMEPVVATLYTQKTGRVANVPPLGVLRHPERDHLFCTPDRFIYRGFGRVGPLELKTSTTWRGWGPDGSDQVPVNYSVQVQHQMLVMGADFAELAVLICGQDLRVYQFEPNPRVWETLAEELGYFWLNHVLPHQRPAPDWAHPRTADLVSRLVEPTDTTTVALFDGAAVAWADQYQRASRDMAVAEADKAEARARLILMMGAHQSGVLADGRRLTRKRTTVKEHVVKERDQVTFRLLPPKRAEAHPNPHDDAEAANPMEVV